MAVWAWSDFPVDSPAGTLDWIFVGQANAIREGIIERNRIVGHPIATADLVPRATSGTDVLYSWLTKARENIETLIPSFAHTTYRYTLSTSEYTVDSWNKGDVLNYIHSTWVTYATCGLVQDVRDWSEARYDGEDPDAPIVTLSGADYCTACHMNELHYALELLYARKLSTTITPLASESKSGSNIATAPDPTDSEAFGSAVSAFNAASYGSTTPTLAPGGLAHTYEDPPGDWYSNISHGRTSDAQVTVPASVPASPIDIWGAAIVARNGSMAEDGAGSWYPSASFSGDVSDFVYDLIKDPSVAPGYVWLAVNAGISPAGGNSHFSMQPSTTPDDYAVNGGQDIEIFSDNFMCLYSLSTCSRTWFPPIITSGTDS